MIVVDGEEKTTEETARFVVKAFIGTALMDWINDIESRPDTHDEIRRKTLRVTQEWLIFILDAMKKFLDQDVDEEEWYRFTSYVHNTTQGYEDLDVNLDDNFYRINGIKLARDTVSEVLTSIMGKQGQEDLKEYLKETSSANEFRNKEFIVTKDKPRGTYSDYLVTEEEELDIKRHVYLIAKDLLEVDRSI